ncbi:MAG TPA: hypothetical protein VER11_17310 [Polyangiaceae bacterium]|nr:hypothetical protein [Polyangiaceae bacterium]
MAEELHDLLVIPSNKKLFRIQANAEGFENPQPLGFYDDNYRNVMNIAQAGDSTEPRGPAFSVLPNKPDPSTSQISCYLINSENLRAANPWTTAAWNSEPNPGKITDLVAEPRNLDAKKLDFLVAGPDGKVWRVQEDKAPTELPSLGVESEIFVQLRNGLVAGSVYCEAANTVLPLVNVTSLYPKEKV